MTIQERIKDWADHVFGPVQSLTRAATRANEEMAELLTFTVEAECDAATSSEVASEMADVVICLYRQAAEMGIDLDAKVEAKHAINLSRGWHRDGTGHGYHHKTEGCKWCSHPNPAVQEIWY